jgi:hypothetical protein
MTSNQKLTALLTGRSISGTARLNDTTTIGFADGSRMTVKTAGSANTGSTGGTVKSVRQEGTELNLDFEDGGTLTMQTEEATSSVMVRDEAGGMEYAD